MGLNMKFSNDKKFSLFIYTNDMIKDSEDKMEHSLKNELEATKSALRLQTIRCRQLVAAFTRKLHEKELELRASKDLKDQQLSRLLRALLILESRLKKEQKQIRQQLQEKDKIIEKQEKELLKLKTLKLNKKWPDSADNLVEVNKWSLFKVENSMTTGEERLDNLCKGLLNTNPVFTQETPNEVEAINKYSHKMEENAFKDNPVLESVNQILLRDEEELLKNVQPVSINLNEKGMFTNEGDSNEWYETNSNTVLEVQTESGAWCINIEDKEVQEIKPKEDILIQEKTSPIKSQLLEEKACLEMSKKNLTVVDLEEIDSNSTERAASPAKSTASYEEIVPVSTSSNYKPMRNLQKPPALPPKPARLLKPYQILYHKNQNLRHQLNDSGSPAPSSQPVDQSPHRQSHVLHKTPQIGPKQTPSLNQVSTNTRHRPPELKSDSKGVDKIRPKPPEANSKPKKNQVNGHLTGPLNQMDSAVASHFGKQMKKDEVLGTCGTIRIGSSVSSLITGLSRDTIVTELSGEPVVTLDDSHVSQLVRQFEVLGKLNTIDSERTEDEVNDIRKNFEEFKLEESYADSVIEGEENGRHEGDGAENKNVVNYYATLTIVPPPLPKEGPPGAELEYKMYETFLESTGLSQKSILTPSRMLSNHRSCLKPKDVKHRNRIKAAAAIEKCNVSTPNCGSTELKYTKQIGKASERKI